jgi:ferredoxin
MNPIDLYWFSGTGNTLLVARAMRDEFLAAGVDCTLRRLDDADPTAIDPTRTLGLACTVACQTTYPPVWNFVEALPAVEGTDAFLVDTMAKASGGILGPMRKAFAERGFTPLGAREIVMPSNFLMKDLNAEKNRRTIAAGQDKARDFARELLAGSATWRPPSVMQSILCASGRWRSCWWLVRRMNRLSVDESKCTRCGLCERLCPVHNITRPEGLPVFGTECIACQRCPCFCPTGAIRIGKGKAVYPAPVSAADILDESRDAPGQ